MNKPRTLTARIIGWLKKPKFWLGFVIALAIAAVIGSVVFSFFPCYKTNPKFLQEGWGSFVSSLSPCSKALSARLIAIAGGLVAVAVLFETRRRANAAEKALDQTKESIVQKTFSDAITHLGDKSESVVLGGIHSLLDLAKKNSNYRHNVFNILCAHIKTTTATEEYRKNHEEEPSTAIRILLSSLFQDKEYSFFTVDQAKYRADLSGAYLAGSILFGARLQDSNLEKAQLHGADLMKAQLQHALLKEAQLQRAYLKEAQLQGAVLWKAQLQGADLRETQLQGAGLVEAQLQDARLQQTEMQGAYMYRTQLPHETQMGGSDLRGVSSLEFESHIDFQKRIESRVGEKTDLKGVKFDKVNPDLPTPQNEGTAITGSYTKEEADRWIKEYEKALRKKHQY